MKTCRWPQIFSAVIVSAFAYIFGVIGLRLDACASELTAVGLHRFLAAAQSTASVPSPQTKVDERTNQPSSGNRADGGYLLGTGDHLRVKLIEWRRSQGETYEWPGLGGEFIIDPAGVISLPIIGSVAVANLTAGDAAERIAARLQERVGLVLRPQAAVEVTEYRPFFVVGAVERPNAYPYKPGLNIIEAISLAGGFYRLSALELERQAIEAQGNYAVLSLERQSLLATISRLRAQVHDEAAISFPQELLEHDKEGQIAAILNQERMLFDARRKSLQAQVSSFDQTKSLLESEIQTLNAKLASLERQESLSQKELATINTLFSKGLAIASRQLSLEQIVAQFETQKLDLRLSISRAQQDIARAMRERIGVGDKARNEDLAALKTARSRVSEIEERLETSRSLLAVVGRGGTSRGSDGLNAVKYRYEILRAGVDGTKVLHVTEIDAVQPGDVVKVSNPAATATAEFATQPSRSSEFAVRKVPKEDQASKVQ